MSERYPDDAALLAMEQDQTTGVEYIPTGRSPYYLEFRKLVQRLLLAGGRANDLRVYQDGDLSIGIRPAPGSVVIHNSTVVFGGATGVVVSNNVTTSVWLDANGMVQTGTGGLPADRTSFVPLAEVVSEAGAITSITDLRGQAFLAIPDLTMLGLTADAGAINQALAGINATVDAAALNNLTAGHDVSADSEHRHEQLYGNADAVMAHRIINDSAGGSANVAVVFDLPSKLPDVTTLGPDAATGYLREQYNGATFTLIGSSSEQYRHEGALSATLTGKLIGVVPVSGTVVDVVLSIGTNMQSSVGTDGVTATAKVNGTTLTNTEPKITSAAGAGFKSTARGHGTVAVAKTDGTQVVQKGDVLTVDLTRTTGGTLSQEATNVVAMVVIRAGRPE
ncbi:MAG: hypothetical protein ACYC26_04580 [Phycisphaerales bacterium]